mmetsp:Transcript_16844/g.43242  ORF Transcript_16844/g.43242 Transcript_16844/m.43242 type:complete len:145 (-) Transcript_16844:385-819(-)
MMHMGATAMMHDSTTSMTLCTDAHAFSSSHDMPTAEDLEMELMIEEGHAVVPLIEEPRQPRMSQAEPVTEIRDSEIEAIYEQMQEEAMMDILADLEEEMTPVYMEAVAASQAAREQLLWNVVATPTMMREFSQHVSAHPPIMVE